MSPERVRVYELSKALECSNKDIMNLLESELGVTVKSHSSSIDAPIAKKLSDLIKSGKVVPGKSASKKVANKPAKDEPATPSPTTTPHLRVSLIKKKDKAPSPSDLRKQAEEAERKAKEEEAARLEAEEQLAATKAAAEKAAQEALDAEENERLAKIEEKAAQQAPDDTKKEDLTEVPKVVAEPVEETPKEVAEETVSQEDPSTASTLPLNQLTVKQPTRGRVQSSVTGQPGIKIIKPAPIKPAGNVVKKSAASAAAPHSPAAQANNKTAEEKAKFNTIPPHLRRVGPRSRKETVTEKALPTRAKQRPKKEKEVDVEITEVTIDNQLSVRELAQLLGRTDTDIIKHVFMKGVMVTVNQTLDVDFARTIAEELDITVLESKKEEKEYDATEALNQNDTMTKANFKHLEERAPVISIMGHVDHGKTSLLDAIRKTRHQIVDTEAGGITQSIGAYSVNHNDQKIVFLDTPGHEAFTAMRMRGAQATDIAILVVAADDGVMPQTIEAINHAKAANIPIIVAVNKIDKPDANPDNVLTQLIEHGLTAEDWGGDILVAKVSAIQSTGLDELLDHILLVSELLNLKADATVPATGVIIEAKLDKRRGPLVTALIQNGTLKTGNNILIGSVSGRVRALIDDNGKTLKVAGPSTPVEILGLNDVPQAGDNLETFVTHQEFKKRVQQAKEAAQANNLESRQIMPGLKNPDDIEKQQESLLHFIVKSDTQGSAEAVNDSIQTLSNEEVKIKILHSGTGNITEADVMLASASKATIIGFNVAQDGNVIQAAQRENVTIRSYDIIYHLTEDIERMVVGELAPEVTVIETGRAEVREIFNINKQIIAGCMATEGKLVKPSTVTVIRDGEKIHKAPVASLKRFKDDVKEVAQGFECGIKVEGLSKLEVGDVLVFEISEEKKRTLDSLKKEKAAASEKAEKAKKEKAEASAEEASEEAEATAQ